MGQQGSKGKLLGILVIILLVCSAGVYFLFADRQEPRIALSPQKEYVNGQVEMTIRAGDSRSGLARVRIAVIQEGDQRTVLDSRPEDSPGKWSDSIPVAEMGLTEGSFRVVAEARDSSWSNFFRGREASVERSYVLDTTAPRVELESFRHNVQRGGSGAVAFRVREDPERAGVSVGESFFPAYRQESGVYLGLFAYPYDLDQGQGQPMIEVRDRAGNVGEVSIPCNVRDRRLQENRIRITDRFLNRKMPSFQNAFPEIQNKVDLFVAVNERMRRDNRVKVREIGRDTASRPLWSGRLLRQPGARQSDFAVRRDYFYQSNQISESYHVGIDIASVARSKVPAANSGRIVYADWLGIYGQAVVVDHGLGLQTLYGHLSQIAVNKGQRVDKGEILGRTGATGLAGGDHLHFETMVSGMPVTPVEWWDKGWIGNHILPKINKATAKKTD